VDSVRWTLAQTLIFSLKPYRESSGKCFGIDMLLSYLPILDQRNAGKKYDSGTLKTPECKNVGHIQPSHGVKRKGEKTLLIP